jgi:hypothetical protein
MKPLALVSVALLTVGCTSAASAAPAQDAVAIRVAGVSVTIAGDEIAPSGVAIAERRDLTGFTAVRLSGPIELELKRSSRESVTVKADSNIVPLIETRVIEGDRPALDIRVKPDASFRTSRAPVVVVEFRSLSELEMRGSGSVRADRIEADTFALSLSGSGNARIDALQAPLFAAVISGSGNLVVAGRADQQAYKLSGSGDVAALNLAGRSVKIAIAGSGDAAVHATESLEVSIVGSGDVIYRGRPRISQTIRGTGEVRRAR